MCTVSPPAHGEALFWHSPTKEVDRAWTVLSSRVFFLLFTLYFVVFRLLSYFPRARDPVPRESVLWWASWLVHTFRRSVFFSIIESKLYLTVSRIPLLWDTSFHSSIVHLCIHRWVNSDHTGALLLPIAGSVNPLHAPSALLLQLILTIFTLLLLNCVHFSL